MTASNVEAVRGPNPGVFELAQLQEVPMAVLVRVARSLTSEVIGLLVGLPHPELLDVKLARLKQAEDELLRRVG